MGREELGCQHGISTRAKPLGWCLSSPKPRSFFSTQTQKLEEMSLAQDGTPGRLWQLPGVVNPVGIAALLFDTA